MTRRAHVDTAPPYELDPIFGCHLATGPRDRDGYALHGGRHAHVAAWVLAHGEPPQGREVDHLCRRRHCVAPHHLELVTRAENEWRKRWGHRAKRTTCAAGHDLRVNAIVTPTGGRVCRACNRAAG